MKNKIEEKTKNQIKEKPKIIKFFEKIDIQKNIKDKIKFLLSPEELSFKEFKNILLKINWIIRWVNKKDRLISYDVNLWTIHWTDYLPPENKRYFLEELYNNINYLKDNTEKAILLFYWIQFIHPFSDWNWRTWRFLYYLLKNNYNIKNVKNINSFIEWNSKENRNIFEKEVLSAEFLWYLWKKSFYKSEWIKESWWIYSVWQAGNYNFIENEKLDQYKYTFIKKILNWNSMDIYNFRNIILYKINKYKKISKEDYIKHIDKIRIDWEKILNNLDNKDLNFIIQEYNKYQKYFMWRMLDINHIKKYSNIIKDNNIKIPSELIKINF